MTYSTIKPKSGECAQCGYDGIFAHNAKRLCRICNEKRKQAEKKAKGKSPYRYTKKPTGERALFLAIWNSRPHRCEHCCRHLTEPRAHYFAHIISKGADPTQRLNPANIRLLCYDFSDSSKGCHYLFDHGSREQFNARKGLFCPKN